MNLLSIAVKNFRHSFSFFSMYIASISFVIAVYFSFVSFSLDEVILDKISSDGRVQTMSQSVLVILVIFVVFFMTYFNRFFLRRRSKELAIYSLLGYTQLAIGWLLIIENTIVTLIGFFGGIILGSILHQGIVSGMVALLHLKIDLSKIPLMNIDGILDTAIIVGIVLVILAISNFIFINKTSLIEITKYEKKAEKKIKISVFPSIVGITFLLGGYGLALDILRGRESLWKTIGFSPIGLITAILVGVGTTFLIYYSIPFIITRLKKKEGFFSSINIILIPAFVHRIRTNARTLIMLTLLSASTLTITGVMATTLYYPIAAVSRVSPSEIEFRLQNKNQLSDIENIVNDHIKNDYYTMQTTEIINVTSTSKGLPSEYYLENNSTKKEYIRPNGFECISYSDYQQLLSSQNKDIEVKNLSHNDAIFLKYQSNESDKNIVGKEYQLEINEKKFQVKIEEVSLENGISFANSIGTLVVSDEMYNELKAATPAMTKIVSINGSAVGKNEVLYTTIEEYLNDSPYLQGKSHRISELIFMNSSTLLLISFLVVLFFVATGSILYFNSLSLSMDTKSEYGILKKIGYSDKELRKIIRKQTFLFFIIPFLIGTLDSIFAMIVYKEGLMQSLLGNSLIQYAPFLIGVLITAGIYSVYYFVTLKSVYKNL